MSWAVDALHRACTSVIQEVASPHKGYHDRQVTQLELLPLMARGYYGRRQTSKDQPRALSRFYIRPTKGYPRDTGCIFVEGARSVGITRDETWPKRRDARTSIQGDRSATSESSMDQNDDNEINNDGAEGEHSRPMDDSSSAARDTEISDNEAESVASDNSDNSYLKALEKSPRGTKV